MPKTKPASVPMEFVVGDMAEIGLRLVDDTQRRAVREAISTPEKVQALVRQAGRAGGPTRDKEARVARVAGLRLVFHEKPGRIELVELIEEAAFQTLGIEVRPPVAPKNGESIRAYPVGRVRVYPIPVPSPPGFAGFAGGEGADSRSAGGSRSARRRACCRSWC